MNLPWIAPVCFHILQYLQAVWNKALFANSGHLPSETEWTIKHYLML